MSLRIGTLAAHCRAPRGLPDAAGLVDTAARGVLPRTLAARLGPSLDREAAVVRVRRLDVRIRIDAAALRRGGLSDAWADAIILALHKALARPDGDRAQLRRFPGCANYAAARIAAEVTGAAGASWLFPGLSDQPAGRDPAVILGLMVESGAPAGDVIAELHAANRLDMALAALDGLGLERLVRAIAVEEGGDAALDDTQVVRIMTALADVGTGPRGGPEHGRRQAIGVWLRLDRALPLRGVWNALRLILQLLEHPGPLAVLADAPAAMDDLPRWCTVAAQVLAADPPPGSVAAMASLRHMTPSAARLDDGPAAVWVASDCAAVLMLGETLRRLGWIRQLQDAGHAPRTVETLLLGIVMRLLSRPPPARQWQPGDPVAPAAALLGGLLGEASDTAIARVFDATAAGLPFALGDDWPVVLDAAATTLATAFATRVHGFRQAPRPSIVRQLIRLPGRFLVTATEVRVIVHATPFAIALHMAGMDAPTDPLDWLGGRRVVVVLEGL